MMANWDTPGDCVNDALFRADEPTDGTSDFLAAVRRGAVRAYQDIHNRYPFWWALAYPPGVFVTTPPITGLTLTIAAAGESIAATLSAVYATSLQYYKVLPTGKTWFARITAHTAGTNALTLDAAPEVLAAGSAITIVKDEYQLASNLGLFVDGLWTEDGYFVELQPEERIRKDYGDLPSPSWPPIAFCRLDQRRIRLSHYPSASKRVEFSYSTLPTDIDATDTTTDLIISRNFRWLLADGALYYAYLMKSDKRAGAAKQDYEKGIEDAVAYHRRLMMGIGSNPGSAVRSPYQ